MNRRRISALFGLVLAAGALAGCSATESGSTAARAPLGSDQGNGGAAAPPAPADGSRAQVSQPGLDRKLVRTAKLELAAPNVVEIAGKARDVAVRRGGFAGQEEVRADAATITLHIPSTEFDAALSELSGLVPAENVRSRGTTTEDVTEQLVDLDSRIATQRKSVERVRVLMDRAQTVNEIVQTEAEVTRREADLESLEKRREALSGQVAMSKVTVTVARGDAPPPPAPAADSGFLGGLAGGWQAFLAAGAVVLRVVGVLLPFAVVFGVPGFFVARWWRRRRRPVTPAVRQEAGA